MLRLLALSLAGLVAAGTVRAADLPMHSRLGVVFVKPQVAPAYAVRETNYPVFVFAPLVDIPPLVNGYYGKPGSYYYRSYYGSDIDALTDAYTRLPYACGFYGYC